MMNSLECPVCHEIPLAPIPQCNLGHSMCNDCHSQVDKCPVCRGELGQCRNLALESIVEGLTIKCQYGCGQNFLGLFLKEHEDDCACRPINCPYLNIRGCQFKGMDCAEFLEHVIKVHNIYDGANGNNMELSHDNSVKPKFDYWPPEYVKVDDYHFFAKTFRHDNAIHAFVTIFGNDADAAKYSAKITFQKDDETRELFEGGLFNVPVISMQKSDEDLLKLIHASIPVATMSIRGKLGNWLNRYHITKNK